MFNINCLHTHWSSVASFVSHFWRIFQDPHCIVLLLDRRAIVGSILNFTPLFTQLIIIDLSHGLRNDVYDLHFIVLASKGRNFLPSWGEFIIAFYLFQHSLWWAFHHHIWYSPPSFNLTRSDPKSSLANSDKIHKKMWVSLSESPKRNPLFLSKEKQVPIGTLLNL